MASPRIIKKYPNRRLYDTTTSAYITLAQVKQLVLDNEFFVVRDAKSNDDITRVNANAPAKPSATPTSAKTIPCRTTSANT